MIRKILPYFNATRPIRSTSFILVLAGYLYIKKSLNHTDIPFLLAVFLCFQLIYGAIYVNNDILDIGENRKDTLKRKRPIASGTVPIKNALIFSLILTTISLSLAYLLSKTLFVFEIFFLLFGLSHSIVLKKTKYTRLLSVGTTNSLRVSLGALLAGGILEPEIFFAFLIFEVLLISFGHLAEGIKFAPAEIRPILAISVLSLLILSFVARQSARHFVIIIAITYILTALLYYKTPLLKNLYSRLAL